MAKAVKKKKKGKTPQELMHKHISDKDDVISEDDFKNMEIGADANADNQEPLDIPDDKDRPKDEDKDPDIVTPWDVIK